MIFFSSAKNEDPWKLPNCLPVNKQLLKEFEPYLADLRTMVQLAKRAGTSAPEGHTDLAGQLQRLSELNAQGVLSADEFIAAYKKEGAAITRRQNVHRMADANKAFAHFAW